MPNEHPNDRPNTPTRNGSNVTACKGFSFENMIPAFGKQSSGENQQLVASSFVMIEPADDQMLTEIEESELGPGQIQASYE